LKKKYLVTLVGVSVCTIDAANIPAKSYFYFECGVKEMNKHRKITQMIVLTATVIFLFVLFIVYIHPGQSELYKAISLGLLTSIVAAFVYALASNFIFNDTYDQIKELRRITETNLNLMTKGIKEIRGRDEFECDFWKSFVNNADTELVIAGRTLNRWLVPELQASFSKAILRLIKKSKPVKLIIYKELQDKNEQEELEKLKLFLQKEIFPECLIDDIKSGEKRLKNNLSLVIYEVDNLPYLYSSNGSSIMVGTYFSHVENSKNLLFLLGADNARGRAYVRDFEALLNSANEVAWVTEFVGQLNDSDNGGFSIIDVRRAENDYRASNWNHEKTKKYVFKYKEHTIEAGYYSHYLNGSFVKNVIELPTSDGCPMKCSYCASSSIDHFEPIQSASLIGLIDKIASDNDTKFDETLLVSLMGIGDIYHCVDNVVDFLRDICAREKYRKIKISVSSCYWTDSVLSAITSCAAQFKDIQWTYITDERNKLAAIIPYFNNHRNDYSEIVRILANSDYPRFRINYLMIAGVNDDDESTNAFCCICEPIKDKVTVRISRLNDTKASAKHGLRTVDIAVMNSFREKLTNEGYTAYLYCSSVNDGLNCGQLITE
jgi:adenine C2-methylase RlmN of 23S rRNA A2503 and tRNA A37